MMDNKDGTGKGKTLGLRGGGTETSHVRQSFSHGRTKSVTVEHKRKRILVPKPGAPANGQGPARVGTTPSLSDAEFERRLKAVEAAKAQETRPPREGARGHRGPRGRARAAPRREGGRRARREGARDPGAARRRRRGREGRGRRPRRPARQARRRARPPRPRSLDPAAAQAQAARAEAGRPTGPKSTKVAEKVPAVEEKRGRGKGEDDRRRSGKLTIANATDEEGRQRSHGRDEAAPGAREAPGAEPFRRAREGGARGERARRHHRAGAGQPHGRAGRRRGQGADAERHHGDAEPDHRPGDRDPHRRGVRPQGGARLRVGGGGRDHARLRGRRGQPPVAAAGRDHHGPRRPRQDLAPRRHPQDQRRLRRGGRHHPAYRRLPGDDATGARRSPSSTRRATPPSPPCAPAARR